MPPRSFDELVDKAAFIVDADVTQVRQVLKSSRPPIQDVVTEVTFRVRSAVKGALRSGDSAVCVQIAGRLETDDKVIEVLGEPAITETGRYVLFLNWNPALQSYIVVSSEGVYRVTNGLLEPFGRSDVARHQQSRDVAIFLRDVQARAPRGAAVK